MRRSLRRGWEALQRMQRSCCLPMPALLVSANKKGPGLRADSGVCYLESIAATLHAQRLLILLELCTLLALTTMRLCTWASHRTSAAVHNFKASSLGSLPVTHALLHAGLGTDISVEKDWVKTLCEGHDKRLTRTNAGTLHPENAACRSDALRNTLQACMPHYVALRQAIRVQASCTRPLGRAALRCSGRQCSGMCLAIQWCSSFPCMSACLVNVDGLLCRHEAH